MTENLVSQNVTRYLFVQFVNRHDMDSQLLYQCNIQHYGKKLREEEGSHRIWGSQYLNGLEHISGALNAYYQYNQTEKRCLSLQLQLPV